MLEYDEYIKVMIALIAILNPVGMIPIFISLTSDFNDKDKHSISKMVVLTVTAILLVTLVAGEAILDFFGISINSFRVAGGILILLMAISMLHAKMSATVQTNDEMSDAERRDSIAIVPLATPLLAGPGAISSVILYANKGTSLFHYILIACDICAIAIILYVTFRLVPVIEPRISKTGINIFTRLMGLLLAAIAIEFIANGLKGLFPALV
ncbi:MAG: YchE family NAAT transporter [Gammaproteobacteria bacterium]|nr:YchE family NAAT transporter [Gammaproteobacteria bacterium]MDH5734917.1 YchE family NAAT transporter [Gammaproteobacteria bacterium]